MIKKILPELYSIIFKDKIIKNFLISSKVKSETSHNDIYNKKQIVNHINLAKRETKIYKNKSFYYKIKNIKYDLNSKLLILYLMFMHFSNYLSKHIKLRKISLASEVTITIKVKEINLYYQILLLK